MTLDRIEAAINDLASKVGNMDGRLEHIEHELCGNGQPGLTSKVEDIDVRLSVAEQGVSDWQRYQRGSLRRSMLQWAVTIVTSMFGAHLPMPPQ